MGQQAVAFGTSHARTKPISRDFYETVGQHNGWTSRTKPAMAASMGKSPNLVLNREPRFLRNPRGIRQLPLAMGWLWIFFKGYNRKIWWSLGVRWGERTREPVSLERFEIGSFAVSPSGSGSRLKTGVLNYFVCFVAAYVSPLHLKTEQVRADSRRLLRFEL